MYADVQCAFHAMDVCETIYDDDSLEKCKHGAREAHLLNTKHLSENALFSEEYALGAGMAWECSLPSPQYIIVPQEHINFIHII